MNNRNNRSRKGSRYRDESDRDIRSSSSGSRKTGALKLLRRLRAVRIISMIMCIVFLLFGTAILYYYKILDSINYNPLTDDNVSYTDESGETIQVLNDDNILSDTISDGQLLSDPKILNIMLFGDDAMDEMDGQFGRSDTMLLLSIDNRHRKIKLISFQRDTYVSIPGYRSNKLNAAYAYGGPKLAIQTIEANFGIDIDRYAVVGFESFRNIIDTLGGVDIELTQDEIDYINHQRQIRGEQNMYPYLDATEGMVHLCGGQALFYARNRGWDYDWDDFKTSGDDWVRTERQRNLLKVIMTSLKSANIGQLLQIVTDIGPMITTNLKKNEITVLASNSLKYLGYEFEEISVPLSSVWRYSWSSDGQSIIEITDWSDCRRQLAEFIFEDLVTGKTTSEE